MDKYHHIQYVGNKYVPVLLVIFWAVLFIFFLIFIFNNDFMNILFSENIILMSILIFLCLFGSMFLILNYGIKIFTKKLNIILKDKYLDLNEGEKIIYFKDIEVLKLETITHIRYKIIIGYTLNLEWNNEQIKITIYTGISKAEKRNCDALLDLHEELKKKFNEDNNVRHHCT
jgi:hypothetical protein